MSAEVPCLYIDSKPAEKSSGQGIFSVDSPQIFVEARFIRGNIVLKPSSEAVASGPLIEGALSIKALEKLWLGEAFSDSKFGERKNIGPILPIAPNRQRT